MPRHRSNLPIMMSLYRLYRLCCILAIVGGLVAVASSAIAQSDVLQPTTPRQIFDLVAAGRNVDAVTEATSGAKSALPNERQEAFRLAAWTCIATYDFECAQEVLAYSDILIRGLPASEVRESTHSYSLLLWSYLQTFSGSNNAIHKAVGTRFPDGVTSSLRDPVVFADLHIFAARRSLNAGNFEGSRNHLDKALASTLSLQFERIDAPRLIVRIAGLLVESYDTERALRLLASAEPLLLRIPENSSLACEYLQVRSLLFSTLNNFEASSKDLQAALNMSEKLQVKPWQRSYWSNALHTDLLGIQTARGEPEAIKKLLASHPLMTAKPEILKRGYFVDRNEFMFAVAEEYARLVLNDNSETGWGALMLASPRWTNDPEQIRELNAFGQAAVGLRLLRMGNKDDARLQLFEAGEKRLRNLQERYRQSQFSSPLPYWTDRLLLQFSLAATTAAAGAPNYDFILAAHTVLNRSLQTSSDDALATQAIQDTDEKRRIAQTYQAIEHQRAVWERKYLENLTRRLWSSDKVSEDALKKERLDILYTANEFIEKRSQLRAALLNADHNAGVTSVTTVASVQKLLRRDEAIVLHIAVLGNLLKVCIRSDEVLSSTQPVDEESVVRDARAVLNALTATHPPSVVADRQFPASAAVRLYHAVFDGLEACLQASSRIYLVVGDGILVAIPPAVLLREMPTAVGSGYNLKSAKWMIQSHSFVRTSSITAFVASKRLSDNRRGSLDYLGVGDPVLARPTNTGLTGGELVARGSLPTATGSLSSLQELKETAVEVKQVAALYDPKRARVLVREGASEEAFRLQPLSEFDIIHFATHGLMKENLPGLSEPSLVMTPNPVGDAFDDGLLTSSQIAALPLRARVVVLSACNSARYDAQVISNGIQGLSAAFAIAGVPSMIASLWPIDDATTRALIVHFFTVARSTESVEIADALAVAMRRHLDGDTQTPLLHPRFWAALVVVGDGAVRLTSDIAPMARDLGAFAEVTVTNNEELRSAAPLGSGFVSTSSGDWNGKKFASLIHRRTAAGEKIWEIKDYDIASGDIAVSQGVIYVAGYVSLLENGLTKSVPNLRRVTAEGQVQWSQELSTGDNQSFVAALAAGSDGTALALVGPLGYQRDIAPNFSLLKVAHDGARSGGSGPLLGDGDKTARYSSGYVGIEGSTVLVALSRYAQPKSGRGAFTVNSLELLEVCNEGDAAEVVFLNWNDLKIIRRVRLDRFELSQALPVGDAWVVVGDLRVGCGLDKRAAAFVIRSDNSIVLLWRDTSPFQSSGRGIRRVGSSIEIVGSSQRSVGVRDRTVSEKKVADFDSRDYARYFGGARYGDEAEVTREVFSVLLSRGGVEQRRDFVGAGFPLAPVGTVTNGEATVVYGTVGLRPLWMLH